MLLAAAVRSALPAAVPVPVVIPISEPVIIPEIGSVSAPESPELVVVPLMPEKKGQTARPQSKTAPAAQAEARAKDPVDRVLDQMDVDHDGRISPREARGLWLELFTRLDHNNDGYLDRNEMAAALEQFPGLRIKG